MPPDCIHCGNKVFIEDDLFSRIGVEWQPLCLKCYSKGDSLSLKIGKPLSAIGDRCYYCLATEGVNSDMCKDCMDYIVHQETNFGLTKTEALTYLFYFQTGLRNTRKTVLENKK